MGQFDQLLTDTSPVNGRAIKEDGEAVNLADIEELLRVLSPAVLAQRSQLFQFQDFRADVPAANEYIYRFSVPADKAMVILAREITIAEGPVSYYSVVNGTGFTGGTALSAFNLRVGEPAAETAILGGVTVTGSPVDVITDYLPGAGNKQGLIGNNASAPLILPPNYELFVKIVNDAEGVNAMIKLGYVFAEIDLPFVST